jgi:hypothetical protein
MNPTSISNTASGHTCGGGVGLRMDSGTEGFAGAVSRRWTMLAVRGFMPAKYAIGAQKGAVPFSAVFADRGRQLTCTGAQRHAMPPPIAARGSNAASPTSFAAMPCQLCTQILRKRGQSPLWEILRSYARARAFSSHGARQQDRFALRAAPAPRPPTPSSTPQPSSPRRTSPDRAARRQRASS